MRNKGSLGGCLYGVYIPGWGNIRSLRRFKMFLKWAYRTGDHRVPPNEPHHSRWS
jgi:hypothetical protein